MDDKSELTFKRRKKKQRCRCIVLIVVVVVIFLIGFLIGYFSRKTKHQARYRDQDHSTAEKRRLEMSDNFQAAVDSKRIEEYVKFFSERPHLASSDRQTFLANELKKKFVKYGFDKVEMPAYTVLLSFPKEDKPNTVTLLHNNGTMIYQSKGEEKVRDSSENDTLVVRPVLGYAPKGNVEGDIVYVNYGRVEDFEMLENKLNISVKGKIAFIRYGKIFRGDKVANAARFGASGAILYTDPKEYAPEGTAPEKVYPEGPWMPPTGVQRGSIYTALGIGVGDPQTPGLPSIEGIYRRPINESELPSIPAHAISYGDAEHFLKNMEGDEVPEEWKGALPITYRLGPGLKNNMKVRVDLYNIIETRTIYNVIGTIFGREEPDRWVLIGNHRDSWVFGAVDAVTGTGVTLEIARVLGELRKEKWRPRRTVKVCGWGGEEYSVIGSREWVEEHREVLNQRAVAYLNVDIAVGGSFVLEALATPLLKDLFWKWVGKVKDPNAKGDKKTVYDVMLERHPSKTDPGKPEISVLTSVSDFAHFYHHMGIPSTDLTYQWGYNNKLSYYPVYHTQHDTFKWVQKFVDPEFLIHKAVAQVAGGMLLDIADMPLLPMNVTTYADVITKSFKELKTSEESNLKAHGISLVHLSKAIERFTNASKAFKEFVGSVTNKEEHPRATFLRRMNDQIVSVEKAFVYPYGLPGRPLIRHVAFAPERYNAYGSASFPGISDTLYDAARGGSWAEVDKQISIVMQAILSASDVIKPEGEIHD